MSNGNNKNWLGFLLLKFVASKKRRVLTEILFAIRQESLCPSSSSPFWSSPVMISLSCVLLCSLTFSFDCFPQCPDLPGTNFPEKQQPSAANSMLISCFLFLLELFPFIIIFNFLCLEWSCGTFSSGKPYTSIPYYFCSDDFAPIPTKTQVQGENLGS